LALAHYPKRAREEIPVIVRTKLPSRFGERGTRDSTCNEIDLSAVARRVPLCDVFAQNIPVRPVNTERRARVRVELDHRQVLKTCFFQPERLSPGACTDFDRGQFQGGLRS
jgi:hypothetical protein